MQSPLPSSRLSTMSERQSYESRIADLKLKRFASHWQSSHGQTANPLNGEPRATDNDTRNLGNSENTQLFAKNVSKGLKVGQAGMIWGSDGTLLGKVQDDSLANPKDLEGYLVNDKGEVVDEYGQIIGQVQVYEKFAGTRFKNTHSFYKIRPDEEGWYHCPYAASDVCWYKPQESKPQFESVIFGDLSIR